jgi:hypothetical protein
MIPFRGRNTQKALKNTKRVPPVMANCSRKALTLPLLISLFGSDMVVDHAQLVQLRAQLRHKLPCTLRKDSRLQQEAGFAWIL